MSENGRFFLAMIAPVGITIMAYALGIKEVFVGGLIFTALIILARFLRSIR